MDPSRLSRTERLRLERRRRENRRLHRVTCFILAMLSAITYALVTVGLMAASTIVYHHVTPRRILVQCLIIFVCVGLCLALSPAPITGRWLMSPGTLACLVIAYGIAEWYGHNWPMKALHFVYVLCATLLPVNLMAVPWLRSGRRTH